MGRLTSLWKRWWTRALVWRYGEQQVAVARQDRDADERLTHQREGGSPYGPPPMPRA